MPAVTAADEPARAVDDQGDRFVVTDGSATAALTYLLDGDQLTLLHTGVPASLEGRGIGGTLVRAAVERAAREQLTIRPWCAFARTWLRGHPDVAGTVAIDWTEPDGR
jgi:predicted GNAT family acetyltransferase